MKGSYSAKGSGSSAYSAKSKGPMYPGQGKTIGSYGLDKKSLGGYGSTKNFAGYPPSKEAGQSYQPPIPLGYSKGAQKNNSKGKYLEMIVSDFSEPFGQKDLQFNTCEVCNSPIPKPLRRCINCASGFGGY